VLDIGDHGGRRAGRRQSKPSGGTILEWVEQQDIRGAKDIKWYGKFETPQASAEGTRIEAP